MPCYWPLQAWRGPFLESGKRAIVWKRSERAASLVDSELRIPCGQCIGCRLERSRQWAIRCVHEAKMHERNCFVTLTYEDSHLPAGGSLRLKDFQDFMKRLRKYAGSVKIGFFHCGEYGENFARPHYHACLFNWDFADKVLWRVTNGVRLYRSARLDKLWGHGFTSVGDVTFESAAYVARYVMKKVTGANALEHYTDVRTGVCVDPEYVTMSRRPGVGNSFFKKFKLDLYPGDYAIMRGIKMRPAKYYDSLYEKSDPEEFAVVKARRASRGFALRDDNDSFRLGVKETCKKATLGLLSRKLEAGI